MHMVECNPIDINDLTSLLAWHYPHSSSDYPVITYTHPQPVICLKCKLLMLCDYKHTSIERHWHTNHIIFILVLYFNHACCSYTCDILFYKSHMQIQLQTAVVKYTVSGWSCSHIHSLSNYATVWSCILGVALNDIHWYGIRGAGRIGMQLA